MATVLAVVDIRTGEQLGLKLLLPMQLEEEARARFRTEFRSLSRLAHPNVLRVYESGVVGDRPWFSMELLEGHDLTQEVQVLRDLPPDQRFSRIADIIKQLGHALAYIHDRGLVHRDVKPGNIRVCADGSVKLMDFGVVKEHGTEHTAVGELIGTVAYMAPEQIQGLEPDARVDLYALGAVMYLLLTGARVFSAHSIHGFMDKHLNEPPTPPQSIDAKIPDLLQTVALRLLEKDPADRFASAAHLLYALGQRGEEVDVAEKWPPGTVGRIPIKARLHESIERVVKSQAGGAFLLIGPTGYGKTRLLELTGAWAEHRGILTAAGRCRPNDRPFGAFTGVYAALAPDGTHPILQAVFGGEGDAPKERYPVIAAFRDLVESVGPCVILIDDLENADPATLELLVFLIRNTLERGSNPVLFALSLDAPGTRIKHKLAALNAL